ncbi:U1A/U2B"/SNF family RNA-binding protein [Sporobolomyces koalae]|uniref:U1A/U2B'/SNF family RNA-binding protein n=1 Tax=Sporobolomyces koalae TaxID=500713 RepID=UPI0031739D9F
MSANQPSVTLYVSNINSKIPKEEVRRSLYSLFNVYGKVLDVVHVRRDKLRGTAFIVFRDLASSTAAMRGLDGEGFYGKSIRIAYAKSTSHATVELHEGPEAVYAIKLGLRELDGTPKQGSKLTVSGAQKRLIDDKRKEKRGRDEDDEEEEEDEDEEGDQDGQPDKKKGKQTEEDDDAMDEDSDEDEPVPAASTASLEQAGTQPSQVLYVAGLPQEVTTDMLSALFQQYSGLGSVRLLPAATGKNSGSAMIVYESVAQAGVAKDALDGFLVDKDAPIKVDYAAKA